MNDDIQWVIPDVDVLQRCFSRRHPDLLLIKHFRQMVENRRIIILTWVKQVLLERCQQAGQMRRFAEHLAAFPDLHIEQHDYLNAAELRLRLRERAVTASSRQLMLWSISKRIHAPVWSFDKSWNKLHREGCALYKYQNK